MVDFVNSCHPRENSSSSEDHHLISLKPSTQHNKYNLIPLLSHFWCSQLTICDNSPRVSPQNHHVLVLRELFELPIQKILLRRWKTEKSYIFLLLPNSHATTSTTHRMIGGNPMRGYHFSISGVDPMLTTRQMGLKQPYQKPCSNKTGETHGTWPVRDDYSNPQKNVKIK